LQERVDEVRQGQLANLQDVKDTIECKWNEVDGKTRRKSVQP